MSDTLIARFRETAARIPDKEAAQYSDGKTTVSVTYGELLERIDRLAAGLVRLGLAQGDRVAILSENCLEWAMIDFAAISAGCVTVPIYPTLPASQAAYILRDAEARAAFVRGKEQLEKIAAVRDECPDLDFVIAADGETEGSVPFESLEAEDPEPSAVEETERRRNELSQDDTATLIYTSGTTGNPKGVILTHGNFLANMRSCLQVLKVEDSDLFLSFLPLSHVFERMAGHFLPLTTGCAVAYSRGLRYLAGELGTVAPTVMACVPRFYESLQERILKSVESSSGLKKAIFGWSMEQGRKKSARIRDGKPIGFGLKVASGLAHKLVFQKLHERVGGRLRFFISGGAPLALSTAEFFHAAGILILEGYGLTETSPVISVNHENGYRFGTVGPVIPDIETRIAEDGEILTRGEHVMQGYFKLPEETASVIDGDGWFHTGDLGEFDADGFLTITGRKKNLLKLSNGKYVAPEPIENMLKASQYIAEAVVIGDAQKVAGAVIVPSFPALEEFAQREELPTEPIEELVNHSKTRSLYREEIDKHTGELADFERIRVFLLMEREFDIEADELTPTLKVKRKEALAPLQEKIDALYASS